MENVQDVFRDIMKIADLSNSDDEEDEKVETNQSVKIDEKKKDIGDFFKGLVSSDDEDE